MALEILSNEKLGMFSLNRRENWGGNETSSGPMHCKTIFLQVLTCIGFIFIIAGNIKFYISQLSYIEIG